MNAVVWALAGVIVTAGIVIGVLLHALRDTTRAARDYMASTDALTAHDKRLIDELRAFIESHLKEPA